MQRSRASFLVFSPSHQPPTTMSKTRVFSLVVLLLAAAVVAQNCGDFDETIKVKTREGAASNECSEFWAGTIFGDDLRWDPDGGSKTKPCLCLATWDAADVRVWGLNYCVAPHTLSLTHTLTRPQCVYTPRVHL